MSVTLTEQVITGGPLPTGLLYFYSKCLALNMWYGFKFVPGDHWYYCTFPTFPPTTYDVGNWVQMSILNGTNANIVEVNGPPTHASELRLNCHVKYADGSSSVAQLQSGTCYDPIISDVYSSNFCVQAPNSTLVSLWADQTGNAFSIGYNLPNAYYWHGLGKTAVNLPYYYIACTTHTGPPTQGQHSVANTITYPLDVSKCVVVSNSVQCYGSYTTGASIYALLNPNGIMVAIVNGVTAYYQLTVPAGGTIRQFLNGYYLATDASNNVFLYSINNNGTLITQLLGGYNPTTTIELLAIL